jgi:hypothetical protein
MFLKKLIFVRILDTIYPIANQLFTGYLMIISGASDEIAGYFEALLIQVYLVFLMGPGASTELFLDDMERANILYRNSTKYFSYTPNFSSTFQFF